MEVQFPLKHFGAVSWVKYSFCVEDFVWYREELTRKLKKCAGELMISVVFIDLNAMVSALLNGFLH